MMEVRVSPQWPVAACAVVIALAAQVPLIAQTPAELRSAPCTVAPRIDGVRSAGEWDTASETVVRLDMVNARAEPCATRVGRLLLMNSSRSLFVGLQVPDRARDYRVSPLLTDLAILGFCRGEELAEGDDRRVVLPGVWADKHVVTPGKDADDAHRDGGAAMRWRATPEGGEYFIEWQLPLASGDADDVAAVPGGRLRFNVLYADRFGAAPADTEVGGVYGPDMDHAKGWGAMVLAENVGPETPAPPPAWLAKLCEHTGKPDRLEHRLKRLDAAEIDVEGRIGGVVVAELTYPGLTGLDETGQVRIFLPPAVRDDPAARVALIHNAGYEIDDASAIGLLAKGYAVCTPHAHPLNPLGRGVHLDRAIMHAVRRLPFVDPLRVSVQGGSAGGWMTLMLTADAFPLVWSMPDVPPIHWGYNCAYIGEQQKLAGPAPGSEHPRMPVLQVVGPIADQSRDLYRQPFDSRAYLAVSPLAHMATVTVPTLVTFSTADMLVPVDQVGAEFVRPVQPDQFPRGFTSAMTVRFPSIAGKRTLVEVLPRASHEVFVVKAPENASRLGPDGAAQGPAHPVSLPFSQTRTVSVVVLDEGPKEPAVGHFKYAWSLDHEPFRKWAEERGVTPDQLTLPKLERLMKRLKAEPWVPLRLGPEGKRRETTANQLDYPEAERADVILGLSAFAADDARARAIGQIYDRLPARLKALGPRLGDGTAQGVRAALNGARVR